MNYFFYILLITLFSCTKQNSMPDRKPLKITKTVSKQKEIVSIKSTFPSLGLEKLSDMKIHVYDNENEHSFSRTLKFEKESYIRTKMERILYNYTNELLSYKDLYKFQLGLSKESKLSLFKNLKFNDLSRYESRSTNTFQISSDIKHGVVKNVSYKFSFIDSETGFEDVKNYQDLNRYENQAEIIDLKIENNYLFESGIINYSSFVNKMISGEKLIYELVDYTNDQRGLREIIKDKDNSNFIFISTPEKTRAIQLYKDESISSALLRLDEHFEVSINGNIKYLLGEKGEWKFINFLDVKTSFKAGEVFGLYLVSNAPINKTREVLNKSNSQNTKVVQNKSDSIDFYVQQTKRTLSLSTFDRRHLIKRFIGERCNIHMQNCNGTLINTPAIKSCIVRYTKVNESQNISIDSQLDRYISVEINGEVLSLKALVDRNIGSYAINNETTLVTIFPFSSIADSREIKVISRSRLEKIKVFSKEIDCPSLFYDRLDHRNGTYNFLKEYLEGYEAYQEDSFIGEKIFQDILIVK